MVYVDKRTSDLNNSNANGKTRGIVCNENDIKFITGENKLAQKGVLSLTHTCPAARLSRTENW